MCGICGVVNFEPDRPVDGEALTRMARTMSHRGPDDEGFYLDRGAGLGHRRLSIIDLASGRQPMHNEDETIWIVFNGEIYNCPELRLDLESRGHRFYTNSDTETIIHAYEQYGKHCVNFLNGMFAFAIWDGPRRTLFAARDRTGIKPFYYAECNGTFLFASELKAILAFPAVERLIDMTALNQYLTFEYVPTPRTIFQGISKLPPGNMLTLGKGRAIIEQYWDASLAKSESLPRLSKMDCAIRLRENLKEAVRQELISDVPLGVLLSGGIDSSAVAAMMSQLAPGNVQSFSIAFEDPSFDESSHARLVARHLGTQHREATLTSAMMLDLIPRIADFLDEPLGDSSIIPTYLLSKFTREHVKVALGGDGGDELFAGYSTLQAHQLMGYYLRFLPEALRRRPLSWIVDNLPTSFDNISLDFKIRRFVAGQSAHPAIRHHIWLGSFTSGQRSALLLDLAVGHENDSDDLCHQYFDACDARELLNKILYCDMKLYLEGDILPKVDRASMANSLEVRVPILNKIMLDYAEEIPHEFKLRRLTTKYVLRRAVKDLLPPSILKRGKKGFNMPVAKWLLGPLRPLVEDMLSEERLRRGGLFDSAYVRGLLDEHTAKRRDHRKLIWTLLVFELWRDKWAA